MIDIRETREADMTAIESLYPQAFPDEDLLPVIHALLKNPSSVISLVAEIDARVVGHVMFTMCSVVGSNIRVALLAPLAVAPDRQRQGVGTALVRAGVERMKTGGVDLVCVLGDPAYYGRLGFEPESLVEPPYPLPDEWKGAWQSQHPGDNVAQCAGKLTVPPPWREAALWAP